MGPAFPRWVAIVAIVGTVVVVTLPTATNTAISRTRAADTVPNMYSRPPSPPSGARWAPPSWGDHVMGSPDGWTFAYLNTNPDADSVHVFTDTLFTVGPGIYRGWVRYHYRRLVLGGVVGFERYDFDCTAHRRLLVNQEVAYDPAGQRLDSLPNLAADIGAEWRDVRPSPNEVTAAWETACRAVGPRR